MANTLSITPDFVFSEIIRTSTIINESEMGYEQRRPRWSAPLRKFSLQYKTRTKSEFETVRDLMIATLGSYDTLTFTNPNDSVAYTCRFEEDSLEFKEVSPGWYDFEFSLLEVR